jgi:ATP:ADP antiporter, AAA family
MKNSLFGVQLRNRQEIFMLVLTSLQALCIGAFVSLFNIGSHVLFFQSWEPSRIPVAFIISGVFGLALFTLYSFFSNRVFFRTFVFCSLLFIFLLNLLLFLFYDITTSFTFWGIPVMLPFTLTIPFTILVMILFRRSLNSVFTAAQHRRISPVIRMSLMAGIVGASYLLVGALFVHFDILLISGVSSLCIGIAATLQLLINYLHRSSGVFSQAPRRLGVLRSRFYEMFYSRYTLLLVFFVLISAVAGFILHFHFITETRVNYPNTIGLAKFFGFFTGTMFLFVYSVERFLIRKILYSYDSPYSLVLIPSLLTLVAIASLLVDLLVGQSPAFARFSFGFLMVAMLKVGYETTYEAIELPSLRVLFRTLDLRFSNAVIPRLEGSFRMAALLIAGVLVMVLLTLDMGRSLFINLTLLFLFLVWIPVAIFLVRSYQNALRETIRRLKASKRSIEQELLNIDEKSHSLINSNNPVKSINTLSIIEKLEPLTHEKHLVSLLATQSEALQDYLLKRIDENALLSSLPKLKELQLALHHRQHNGYLHKLINRFEIKLSVGITRKSIDNLVFSKTLTDRILAAEIIGNSEMQDCGDHLLQLTRDIEPEVKFASVKAMARLANPNHSYALIGYLTTPAYYPYAFEALIKIGDPALQLMEQAFLLPDSDNILLSRIVRIYGKIGTPAAIDCLLGKVENQNRTIARQALLALREAKFQATPGNINRILNDIVRLINIMSWNFAAFASIQKYRRFHLLQEAFQSEIHDNYNTLYHLLSLAYNPTSIGNIKNMLVDGNDTDISFAIELLDQVVNEEIKQVFFPVVENLPVKERFKQLQYFFQAAKEPPENLIRDIITRDFNQISLYTKSCALVSTLLLEKNVPGQEIIASIFHPSQLIRESAAFVLEKTEPEKLESVYSRLEPGFTSEIRSSLSHVANGIPYLLLDRIRFIKQSARLQEISDDVLIEISRALEIHFLNKDEEFLIKREDVHYAFMILIEGVAQITNSSGKVFTFEKNDIIYSDIFVEDNTFTLRALTDIRLYSLEQEVLNSLMFDYIDFRNSILEMIEEA